MGFIIGSAMIIAAMFILEIYYELHHFEVNQYQIHSAKLKKPIRLVLLSDLHNKQYGYENKQLFEEIVKINPDAVLLAGDMFTAKVGAPSKDTIAFLDRISNRYQTYLGFGNHETRIHLHQHRFPKLYHAVSDFLKRTNMHVLCNKSVGVKSHELVISGLEMDHSFYGRLQEKELPQEYIRKTLGELDPSKFNILIAHNPIYFKEYVEYGADLVVSGHVHGGIMRIPFLGGVISPSLKLFPHYDGGVFSDGNAQMILSRGIGNHTIPIRFLNKAEMIVIELLPQ